MKQIFVVAWEYETGGGYDWFNTLEAANTGYENELVNCEVFKEDNWKARQCIIVVPENMTNEEITDHIEANQDVIWQTSSERYSIIDSGLAYRLSSCKAGSDKYGPCELCGKHADTVYQLVEMQRFSRKDGSFGLAHKTDIFGHKSCLSERTKLHSTVTTEIAQRTVVTV